MDKEKYKEWTLINWGNDKGDKCYRKSFGKGNVSVGVGEFLLVCFSFGPNSDSSYSSTRWNYDQAPLTPEETMESIDKLFRGGYAYANIWDGNERTKTARFEFMERRRLANGDTFIDYNSLKQWNGKEFKTIRTATTSDKEQYMNYAQWQDIN